MESVNEKTVAKWGISVGVSRDDGEQAVQDNITDRSFKKKQPLPPEIAIFIRERYWLESRRIIDLEGNAWRPPARQPSQRKRPNLAEPAESDEDNPVIMPQHCTNAIAADGPDVKEEFTVEGNVFAPGKVIILD